MFDTLIQDGVKVLISAGLPITSLYRFLTHTEFRRTLLAREADADIVAFFRDQFERLSPRDQADQAGAALRRAHLLTYAPVLKYSLGQHANMLDWRGVFDRHTNVTINLGLGDHEARRLLGCLITVFAEQGALSRADLPPGGRHGSHHLVIDEFSEFTAQSEEALARMLSLTRKFGLYLVMAHQTYSQASDRLRGALQNVGVEVAFRLGREDAVRAAGTLGRVDALAVKHEATDPQAQDRGHPLFYSLPEQWERWVQALQDLPPQHAFVKLPMAPVTRVRTLPVPDPTVDADRLREVKEHYLRTCFRQQSEIEHDLEQQRRQQAPRPTVVGGVELADDFGVDGE
jgi:hypothetical protein